MQNLLIRFKIIRNDKTLNGEQENYLLTICTHYQTTKNTTVYKSFISSFIYRS